MPDALPQTEPRALAIPLVIERAQANADSLEIPCSFASDAIVDDPFLGPVQLSMAPEAVDLGSATARGIPVMEMHQRELPVGRVFGVRLDGNRLLGTIRFSRSDQGRQLYQDCADGIITDTSVGASISAVREESSHLVALRWQPREVSLVDRGADPTVGIARRKPVSPPAAAPAVPQPTGVLSMPEPSLAAEPTGSAHTNPADNAASIMRLAAYAHGRAPELGLDRMGEDFSQCGRSFAEFQTQVWDLLRKRQEAQPAIGVPASELGLNRQETEQFSIVRAALAALNNDWKKAGFELECSRSIAERLGRPPRGFFVPAEVQRAAGAYSLMRTEQSAGDPTYGGFLVGTDHRADLFIEALRSQSVALQAGVRTLPGLVGNVQIPKQTGNATFAWINEGQDGSASNLAFGAINMGPRTIAGAVPMTRRLLMQSSPAIEQLVRSDLVEGAALALDLAIFEGTGAAGQPLGIVNHASINTVAVTTDGTPTWDEVVQFETEVATDNALAGALSYITTPAVRGKLKVTPKATNQAIFISDGNTANGFPVRISNQLATHTLLFGDWSQIMVGFWGVLDIKPDESTLAASGGLVLRAFQDADVAIRHAVAFAKAT